MPRPPLACSVRGCGAPLARHARAFVCPTGHSHDIARCGYVNLLQPQDRRSLAAGDTKAAVTARAALLAAGVGRTLLDTVVQTAVALDVPREPVVVDLGSGSGDALAALAEIRSLTGIGIDLSRAAAEHAARRFPRLTWVVANADRRLPLLDGSVDLVLSLHGRRNPAECDRVLRPGGHLLIALPAKDDLIELRAFVQGQGLERPRGGAMLAGHEPFFEVRDQLKVRETRALDHASIVHLLQGTYRGARTTAAARIQTVQGMTVTLSADVFVLRRR